MRDDGGGEQTISYVAPPGDEDEQDDAVRDHARAALEQWVRACDWGPRGLRVEACAEIEDDEYALDPVHIAVEIEPDHRELIADATDGASASCGDDPSDHDWQTEQDGVWGLGAAILVRERCTRCGLRRETLHRGNARNPGEADTVEYTPA
jgi:hypothetical protein